MKNCVKAVIAMTAGLPAHGLVIGALIIACAPEPVECPGGHFEGSVRKLAAVLDAGRVTAGRVEAAGVEERGADVCLPQLRRAWTAFGPEWRALDDQLREQGLRLAVCGAGLCIEEAPGE